MPSSFGKLVRALLQRTSEKAVAWKEMPDSNAFQAILSNGRVIVRKAVGYDSDEHPFDYGVVLLLDDDGQVIDEYSGSDDALDLFQKARANARDSEGVISKLLNEIQA